MGVVAQLAAIIEFIGALLVVAHVLWALGLAYRQGAHAARVKVSEGAIAGLDFKLAATLLKTLQLASWRAIWMFTVILALRTFLKMEFKSVLR